MKERAAATGDIVLMLPAPYGLVGVKLPGALLGGLCERAPALTRATAAASVLIATGLRATFALPGVAILGRTGMFGFAVIGLANRACCGGGVELVITSEGSVMAAGDTGGGVACLGEAGLADADADADSIVGCWRYSSGMAGTGASGTCMGGLYGVPNDEDEL